MSDGSYFLDCSFIRGDGTFDTSLVGQINVSKLEQFTLDYSRVMFPSMKETFPRWRDVSHHFCVLVFLCERVPEFEKVLQESLAIVR
jgi:hypothetical protein